MSAAAPRPRGRLRAWAAHHLWVAGTTVAQLARTPLSTLMTAAVIAIALALPAGLQVLLHNAQRLAAGWEGAAQISVFLSPGTPEDRARALRGRIAAWPAVARVDYVSPAQAMAEFRAAPGFGEALDALEENPLPAVLVVHPRPDRADPVHLEPLLARLRALGEVDMALLDMAWVRRLDALLALGRRGVQVLGALLALAILLVVGNTIRLTINNRREEIVVTKLIGATDAFIRRPFLYAGLAYGLAGGLLAWALVAGLLAALSGPAARLALLYQSGFRLAGPDAGLGLALLGAGAALGLLGSWLAVGRHLRDIEPA